MQVGAAILLGFVVIAITMYQVQVVPDQNADVEFNHNQEVHQDMIDLRNAITEVGQQDSTQSVSVKMGTQYPPRSIFVNPPPPKGTLRTESIGEISIQNATVTNLDEFENDSKVENLLTSNHTTSHVFYDPDYTEFDGAPTTFVEHSLAYDTFSNGASRAISPQNIVNGGSLTLTILRGNVSQQGSGTFTLDPRTVSGPTDTIEIQQENNKPITITLPTANPDVWNATFAENDDASVVGWNAAAQTIRVELAQSRYDLQMAMVGIGNGVPESSRYNVQHESGNGSGGGGGAYSVDWANPDQEGVNCGSNSCTWDVGASGDDTLDLFADSGLPEGFEIQFGSNDDSVGTLTPTSDQTDSNGRVSTTLQANAEGTVTLSATSGGGGDLLEITITNIPADSGPSIQTRIDDLTGQSQGNVRLIASYNVQGANDSFERVDVTFVRSDGNEVPFERSSTMGGVLLGPTYGSGTSFEIVYEVIYTDSNGDEYVASSTTAQDTANGQNPVENDDLATSQTAQFQSWTITDWSQDGSPRYRYTYDVSQSGSFSEVIAHALNVPGSGESGIGRFSQRSRNNRNIQLGYGGNQDYRIGYVLRGANGAVVDIVTETDNAEGSGVYSGP
ncbi:hypothetical protein GCM10028857_06910 [Salinarchaeum chitinilyticum]